MFTIGKWIAAPLLAAGLVFTADTPTAEARGGYFGIGVGGVRVSVGYPAYGGYGRYGRSCGPSYGSYYGGYGSHFRGGRYHDTSHYDWHPTEVRRHGNHYDVFPGHYDFHRTGHYHH